MARIEKIKPAGLGRRELNAVGVDPGAVRSRKGDRPDPDRARRPCASCGRKFQPTLRRRLLCLYCFSHNPLAL